MLPLYKKRSCMPGESISTCVSQRLALLDFQTPVFLFCVSLEFMKNKRRQVRVGLLRLSDPGILKATTNWFPDREGWPQEVERLSQPNFPRSSCYSSDFMAGPTSSRVARTAYAM